MKRYISIFVAIIRDRFRNEKAYLGNMLSETASTVIYVITYLAFINLLFAKIGSLAGYSKNDILFMMLVGQFTYYLYGTVMLPTMYRIITTVRSGEFDLILLRPINKLFYLYSYSIKPFTTLLVSLPNLLLLIYLIDWSTLNLSPLSITLGFVCWLCAILIINTINMALAYPVFTKGEATDLLNASYSIFAINEIPYEKLPRTLKVLSFSLVPTLLSTGGVTYIALQKGPILGIMLCSIIAGFLSLLIFKLIWKKAMSSYASASS
ncbi:ABC-2 family transporter protein [Candidatus Saccharibacteria bacterium]|nr:ABC-2 family transporter protein [Candidatus Saccharibacteria bacterium]MBP7834607.1 ABC-2 family transporter protein [Candidatus Saccharibacteria bacterium]